MKYPPSSLNDLKRKALILLLLATLGPALLTAAAQVIETTLAPFVPWVIATIILAGVYSFVIGRWPTN